MKYIHYGNDHFDRRRFNPIINPNYGWTKPQQGGLWASEIGSAYGWEQWCRDNDYLLGNLTKHFTFDLSPDARVCHLRNSSQLECLPRLALGKVSTLYYYCIDFEKAMEDYDAIQLHLSEQPDDGNYEDLYFKLYGWDCDSILILNPDIIMVE